MGLIPVEVRCRSPRLCGAELSKVIISFIRQQFASVRPGEILPLDAASDLITAAVEQLRVCDAYCPHPFLSADEADYAPLPYFLHSAHDMGAASLHTGGLHNDNDLDDGDDCGSGSGSGSGGGALPACTVLPLPNVSLEGLWESLHYGDTAAESAVLKRGVLQYMRSAMVFSTAGVNPHMVAWSRLLLLHGPPGTGKTSLCKALAQKLAIRLGDMFPVARLVEINAHSLFSRWFSESGKQVMTLFRRIHEMAEEKECLLCVLVDEVESLAAARQSAMRGNEPSDAIRVVNALLTQLDSLQRRQNVIVLTTSNITGAIDVAFIDRADKKIFIGPPGLQARLALLRSSALEMMTRGLVRPEDDEMTGKEEQQLVAIAQRCDGFSGRVMKKLPLLAYSESTNSSSIAITFTKYLKGLEKAVTSEVDARAAMTPIV